MEFSRPESYTKQISEYLKAQMNDNAYRLSADFVKRYPGELMPHMLLAESAFRLSRYDQSKVEARKGLKLSQSEADIRFCAMVFSTACFQLKDYIEGYETLKKAAQGKFIQEVEEMLLILSWAMADEQKALRHMKNLMTLNRERALEFIKVYAESLPLDGSP